MSPAQTLTRLTFDPGSDRFPVWTPDGRRIAFTSMRAGASNLFWQAADGTGPVERLTESANEQNPTSFSPAGTRLVFYEVTSSSARDIVILPLEGERGSSTSAGSTVRASSGRPAQSVVSPGATRATPLVQTTFNEWDPEVSPDGRWVAYGSNESGQSEIYVAALPRRRQGALAGLDRWRHGTPLGAQRARAVLPGTERAVMSAAVEGGSTFASREPDASVRGAVFIGPRRTATLRRVA